MAEPKFSRGAILERDDLSINLVDSNGSPVDAYEISFALYDVTTGQEVQIGPSERDPAHPEVGTYWAPVRIPRNANLGLYRIRWTFKRDSTSNENTVMEEFEVIRRDEAQSQQWDDEIITSIGSLRKMLRDNCVDGDEYIEVRADNEVYSIQIGELWEILNGV